jgi:hypothetical protein
MNSRNEPREWKRALGEREQRITKAAITARESA